jgi:hypothetical protein
MVVQMSYKDMAFCTAKDCRNLDCIRNTARPDFQPGDMPYSLINFKWKCKEYKKEQGE